MTREEFNTEISGNKAVVADFSATWCGPCKTLAKTMEELEKEYDGQVKFINIDVEESDEVAQANRIRNVPTVIYYKDGQVISKTTGNVSAQTIRDNISKII